MNTIKTDVPAENTIKVSFINSETGKAIPAALDLTKYFQQGGKLANVTKVANEVETYLFDFPGRFELVGLPPLPHGCDTFTPVLDRLSFCVENVQTCLDLPYSPVSQGSLTVLVQGTAPQNHPNAPAPPVRNASVVVWPAEQGSTHSACAALPAVMETNGCGLAIFEPSKHDLQRGVIYRVAVSPPAGLENHRVLPAAVVNYRLCGDESKPLEFTIAQRCSDVTWLFVHDGCDPIPNTTLHLCETGGRKHASQDVTTNADGLAKLALPPGHYALTAPGYTFPNLVVHAGLQAASLQGNSEGSLVMIAGDVTFANGGKAPATPVQIVSRGRVLAEASTDSSGHYCIGVRPQDLAQAHLRIGTFETPLAAGGEAAMKLHAGNPLQPQEPDPYDPLLTSDMAASEL